MNVNSQAKRIVSKMMEEDSFSKWLGIQFLDIQEGSCKLKMTVTSEMINGHNTAHGGISYSLADSAFAFASNARGKVAVGIETSISHVKPVKLGDDLIAIAIEENKSNKLGQYKVDVFNQKDELVALFKGTVYRTSKNWLEE